ncbi:hypothetical protein ABT187_45875 [Streptomyces sp. NPDC001817]|uniref:hypothetical protein n=1 Tax=Streptomyces sp. NPDC001817 TaxID=3154398 RepID=UPI003316CE79
MTANRWRLGEVLGRARDTDWSRALPGAGLAYAVGAGAVLAAATALWGPRPGMIVAAGAVNAGTVGTTPGLARPRAAMGVSLAALAAAAFLGMVTALRPALSVVTLVLLRAIAGLLARTGQDGGALLSPPAPPESSRSGSPGGGGLPRLYSPPGGKVGSGPGRSCSSCRGPAVVQPSGTVAKGSHSYIWLSRLITMSSALVMRA